MINNHLNLPKKIVFETGEITYLYDATGVKLKKTVTDNASQTTNTHYIDTSAPLSTGYFQYTGDHLDFFQHAEGYVNVLDFSEFHYIYTYKDHTSAPLSTGLGNIRLKYTKDPATNQTEILEENHYYPYGMTHKGYNGSHPIFWQMPGTGIDLVEVTPLMGDKYKYGFGGMEYQEELALNHYDFGARNGVYPERSRGNPALGRGMNIDPLAELMRRHSPYNYAFNNPVFFIDPDGMMSLPFGGSNTGSFESYGGSGGGFDVRTYDENGKTLDFISVGPDQGVDITADGGLSANNFQTPGDVSTNNAGAFKSFFQQVSRDVAKMDGGGCPDGIPCEGMQRGNTPIPVGDSSSTGSSSKPKATEGTYTQVSAGFAFIGGFGISAGKVSDASGNSKFYFTFDGNIGYGLGLGIDAGVVVPTGSNNFSVDDFGGNSGSYNGGIGNFNFSTGGSLEKNWSGREKINPQNFGKTDKGGYRTFQGGLGVSRGIRFGGMFSYGTTKVF